MPSWRDVMDANSTTQKTSKLVQTLASFAVDAKTMPPKKVIFSISSNEDVKMSNKFFTERKGESTVDHIKVPFKHKLTIKKNEYTSMQCLLIWRVCFEGTERPKGHGATNAKKNAIDEICDLMSGLPVVDTNLEVEETRDEEVEEGEEVDEEVEGEKVDEELLYLMNVEAKIKEMKVEWAKADGEDAAFIESKIRDMEEFLIEAKKELGIDVDTEMKEATENKKRGRNDVVDSDEDAAGNSEEEGEGFLARFRRS